MVYYIGCDTHKKYSVFTAVDEGGRKRLASRVEHDRRIFRTFLESLPDGSPIAVETTGTGTGSLMRWNGRGIIRF